MKASPLVSVCVPTYNQGRFIRDCLESVLAQTLSDWELIVLDDCSTDDTFEIVQAYAAADSRIRYQRNERRLGMNGNIKRAAESGHGKYLKMLCSDDWMVPQCLEVFTSLLEANQSVVIAASAEYLCDEAGVPLRVQFLFGAPELIMPGEAMLTRMSKGEGFGGHSSFFIRSSAYDAIGGYDDSLVYAADLDIAARLCRLGDYLHVDMPLFYGRLQSESSSSVNPGKLLDVIDSFDIPKKVFQPRRFGNREWRRYQRLTASLTARYLVNATLQNIRGRHSHARNLRGILWKRGNFLLGIPWLAFHAPLRLYRKITKQDMGRSIQLPARPNAPISASKIDSPQEFS